MSEEGVGLSEALLLDTHALLWWLFSSDKLSVVVREAIAGEDRRVCVSAVSAWEIATKHRLGKLPEAGPLVAEMPAILRAQNFEPLSITLAHALAAGRLDFAHRDPFDRMLIAQALGEDLTLVTNESLFEAAGVRRLW